MGVRLGSAFTSTLVNALPANATETIVLTTPAIGLAVDNAAVIIQWQVPLVVGVGTTSIVVRIRRGTLIGGTDITGGGITTATTAGTGISLVGIMVDTPGVVAGAQYSVTLVQSGATGAGALGSIIMFAMVL